MIHTDVNENAYVEYENVRFTYIRGQDGDHWDGRGRVRIQAYRGEGNALHLGAEMPVGSAAALLELFRALLELFEAGAPPIIPA